MWENLIRQNIEKELIDIDIINSQRYIDFKNYTLSSGLTFKHESWWKYLSAYCKLSEDFISKYSKYLIYVDSPIYSFQSLNLNFLKKFKDKVSWSRVITYQQITEEEIKEILKKYINKYTTDKFLLYTNLVESRQLSKEFLLKEVVPKLHKENMFSLFKYQQFPEEYLEKFILSEDKDSFSITSLSSFQKLSKEFIYKYIELLNPISLYVNNLSVDNELEEFIKDKYSINNISNTTTIKSKIIKNYRGDNNYFKLEINDRTPYIDGEYKNYDLSINLLVGHLSGLKKDLAILPKNLITSLTASGKDIKILKIKSLNYNKFKR